MCGITGKLYYQAERLVEPEALTAMCQQLIHRGPDDDGYYLNRNIGLAMRRLAIIDLPGGKQPIHNENRTVWAIFNGEIYNFSDLRHNLEQRGHRFYTRSDTEVIVHLYEEYGIDFPRHLNGMFAIALWDETERRLVLTRDHLGIKPLYYATLPDRLLFGSEIKSIRADHPQLTVDLEALNLYLSLLYIPAPYSMYREIRKLEPGHTLVWQDGHIRLQRYWNLAAVEQFDRRLSLGELQEELRTLLSDATRRQLVADVPVGIFLSGGIDSSTVVAFARQVHNGSLRTFAIGFDDPSYDETAYARLIAERFGTEHTEMTVRPDAASLVPKLVDHFDEPFADSAAIPTYYVSQLARPHVTVALGGDGGDEIFSGYLTYQADKLARLYDKLPHAISRRLIPSLVQRLPVSDTKVSFDFKARRFVEHALLEPGQRHYAWKAFFNESLKRALLAPELLDSLNGHLLGYEPYRQQYEAVPHLDPISRFQYADTKVYLPDDNLVRVDRMSMAHSLEVRVPLLDHRVVEFAFRLPGRLKMPGLRLKHFLRETMRPILPAEILDRRKRGFNVPMSRWLKHELRPLVDTYLAPGTIQRQGYFQPGAVLQLVHEHMAGRADYSRNIWALLLFNLWVEQQQSQRRAEVDALPAMLAPDHA